MAKKKTHRSAKAERVKEAHMLAVQTALLQFQALEEALKSYIEGVFIIIRLRTEGFVPFTRSRTELEGLSLGRLIDELSKHADEPKLVADLKGLVRERNHCAHAAFLVAAVEAVRDSAKFSMTIEKLEVARRRARAATGQVIGLIKRLRELVKKLHRNEVRRQAAARKHAGGAPGGG